MRTVTVYSYKGGTGRTLLLANLAVLAARAGKRIVAVDFDLEAPGLAFKLFPDDRPRCDGLVGWLRDALAEGEAPTSLEDYVVDVAIDDPLLPGGWLKLMPAGRSPSPNYFQDLARLHLDQRLDDGSGTDALIELQRGLDRDLGADFVLLDARTGITSTNAVTTHVLADEVVALTLDTPEQLEGTRAVLRALEPTSSLRTGEAVRLHVVLARVTPKPKSTGPSAFELTETEQATLDRVRRFLNQPAQPARYTLDVARVNLVHTEPAFTAGEVLSFGGFGWWTTSAFHIDHWRIAVAVFGSDVEDVAVAAMDAASSDPDRLEGLARFFVARDRLEEARALRVVGPRPLEGAEPRAKGLEDQVAALRRRSASDAGVLPDLAARLSEVARRLRELGRRDEALAAGEEAVALYRRLADADPAAYEAHLAASLHSWTINLGQAGQPDEALAAGAEAVALRRRLVAADPAAHEAGLAYSLHNWAIRLGESGRLDDALAVDAEAVALRRRLVAADPAAHEADLAHSLHNWAIRLDKAGRLDEGLIASEEVVALRRRLVEADPATHQAEMAGSLHNLARLLDELGRDEEAQGVREELQKLTRSLLANPSSKA